MGGQQRLSNDMWGGIPRRRSHGKMKEHNIPGAGTANAILISGWFPSSYSVCYFGSRLSFAVNVYRIMASEHSHVDTEKLRKFSIHGCRPHRPFLWIQPRHTADDFTCVHALRLSYFSRVQLCYPMDCTAHQAPLSMGFSSQEYWSGFTCTCMCNCIHFKEWLAGF